MAERRASRRPARLSPSRAFVCPPDVSWVVEDDGLQLLNGRTGRILRLDYPDAAVWDLAGRGDSLSRIAGKIRGIASCNGLEARRIVARCVAAWIRDGWLARKLGDG